MDQLRNPFLPGAGVSPPELAGREPIIDSAKIVLQRSLMGRAARSAIFLGLRGTGKTVLLNQIQNYADELGHQTTFIEGTDEKSLVDQLLPLVQRVLQRVSGTEAAKAWIKRARDSLQMLASSFEARLEDVAIGVTPPKDQLFADLETDLTDLFVNVGRAAKASGSAWTLLIDEVQYLRERDLGALIVAIHRCNQLSLPVVFYGAGLPQVAALSGNAKSYAERLFEYPKIDALPPHDAARAISQPLEEEGESIQKGALDEIVEQTGGYPYFLQQWGKDTWDVAKSSPITRDDVRASTSIALGSLDQSFFRVRLDRLSPAQKEYCVAMAALGSGPYKTSDIADLLDKSVQSLGPRRAEVIAKGMVYSPSHGTVDFTVPKFDDFLRRTQPDAVAAIGKQKA